MNYARMSLVLRLAEGLVVGLLIALGACVGEARAVQADATVAPNGDGQFKSIQEAINAAPQPAWGGGSDRVIRGSNKGD